MMSLSAIEKQLFNMRFSSPSLYRCGQMLDFFQHQTLESMIYLFFLRLFRHLFCHYCKRRGFTVVMLTRKLESTGFKPAVVSTSVLGRHFFVEANKKFQNKTVAFF